MEQTNEELLVDNIANLIGIYRIETKHEPRAIECSGMYLEMITRYVKSIEPKYPKQYSPPNYMIVPVICGGYPVYHNERVGINII